MAAVEYAWDSTHYARRKVREARHAHDCRKGSGPARAPTCGGAFRCAKCGNLAGWCRGAWDDHPDWCDSCWYRDSLKQSDSGEKR